MKGINKTAIVIFCFFLFSCKFASTIDYRSIEEEQFVNDSMPITQFARYSVDGNFIFVYLRNFWAEEAYIVTFTIFNKNDEIPKFKISNIRITDESGNTVLFCSEFDLGEKRLTKIDETYKEGYNSYGTHLDQNIPYTEIPQKPDEKYYYVTFEINGKKIRETLEMYKRTYLIMR